MNWNNYQNSRLCSVMLLLFVCFGNAQEKDYAQVDATIQLYPETFNSAEELSYFISRDFKTDDEKVRAIYGWLIYNIEYEPNEYNIYNYTFRNYRERNAKDEKLRENIIKRTLSSGKAVCEGYAMVFEKLCELQEIPGYLVWGDIKTSFRDIGRQFSKNHMWNIVNIDGKRYIFDATWGAGKYHDQFIAEPSYAWYKTNPESFLKTHYPQLEEDTLVRDVMSAEAFAAIPLIIDPTIELSNLNAPKTGVLNGVENKGGILFILTSKPPKSISYSLGNDTRPVLFTASENDFSFKVPVKGNNKDLLIYFDGKPALALKVR